jgi:fluoride ion exporter CrcB/FEX
MLETHRLAEEGALARAALNVTVSLGVGVGAALIGRAIGMHA